MYGPEAITEWTLIDPAVIPMLGTQPFFSEPKIAPTVRLPSTKQIDARDRRIAKRYQVCQQRSHERRARGISRYLAGKPPRSPRAPVHTFVVHSEGSLLPTLVFQRAPTRKEPDPTPWIVPCVHVHPVHGPLFYLDSYMIKNKRQQYFRTVPSRRLLITKGPTPDQSVTFKALQQKWVRIASERDAPCPSASWAPQMAVLPCSGRRLTQRRSRNAEREANR